MHQLKHDQTGAAAVEFAVVAGVFFMLMFGIIEYGMIMLTKVAIESTAIQVGRQASIGNVSAGCADRVCEIQRAVAEKTQGLVDAESVNVSTTVISSPTSAAPPVSDICLDNPDNPYPTTCGAWQENNGSPESYDPPSALNGGAVGNGGDLIEIRVTHLWHVLFPMFRSYFGDNGAVTISATTVIKNEPF